MLKKPGFAALFEAVMLLLVGLVIVVAAAYARGATLDGGSGYGDVFGDPPTVTTAQAPTDAAASDKAAKHTTVKDTTVKDTTVKDKTVKDKTAKDKTAKNTTNDASSDFDEILAQQYDGSRQRLRALGLDDSHFEKLIDGRPIVSDEHETLLLGLNRLGDISRRNLEKWTRPDVSWNDVIIDSRAAAGDVAARQYRGQIFSVTGRLTRVEVRRALPSQIPFFDTDRYFRCEVTQEDGQPPVVVFALKIPKGWRRGQSLEKGSHWSLDEPVQLAGVFLKSGPAEPVQNVILMTRHLAWYPDRVDPALGVAAQHVLLAGKGMDIGLFDDVANRKKISGKEQECFYRMLSLMGQVDAKQVERDADNELKRLRDVWTEQAEDFQAQKKVAQEQRKAAGDDDEKVRLLNKKIRRLKNNALTAERAAEDAENGHFSFFPLYNFDQQMQCQLVTLEGTARRILKVQIDDPVGRPEQKQDIVARFGLDHYYQIYLFPMDSKDNPVVICLREIPDDLPIGDDVREHVKVTAFFYKNWTYRNRSQTVGEERQFAPLLIGRRLKWYPKRESPLYDDVFSLKALMAGGLVLLALLGLCLALWLWRRGDKKFAQQTIAKIYSVEPGESLNEMGLEADDGPDFSGLK